MASDETQLFAEFGGGAETSVPVTVHVEDTGTRDEFGLAPPLDSDEPLVVHSTLTRRRRHIVEIDPSLVRKPSPPPDERTARARSIAYKYNCWRRFADARDRCLMNYPSLSSCFWRTIQLAFYATLSTLVALAAFAFYRLATTDTTRTLETRDVASDYLQFVRSPPHRFDVASPSFGDTCASIRLHVESPPIRRVRSSIEQSSPDEPCLCAPFYGVRERLVSFRVDSTLTHAYNASVAAESCSEAEPIERYHVLERMAERLFGVERERVRARCVSVDYVDSACRPLRAHLVDAVAYCVQLCGDLFDGRL